MDNTDIISVCVCVCVHIHTYKNFFTKKPFEKLQHNGLCLSSFLVTKTHF